MKRTLAPIAFSLVFFAALVTKAQEKSIPELDQLNARFDAQVRVEVEQSFQKAMTQMDENYLTALNRELAAAQQSGKLSEVQPFQGEKERVERGEAIPEQDDLATPTTLKKLRAVHRSALSKIKADKDKKLRPLMEAYAKSLSLLVSSLTRSGRIEAAGIVERKRLAIQGNLEMKRFEGAWDVSYSIGTSRRYRINASGKVEWMNGDSVSATSQIAKKGNDYMLDFNDGKLERISLRGAKLLVEHFDPGRRYPNAGPNTTGTGEKLPSR